MIIDKVFRENILVESASTLFSQISAAFFGFCLCLLLFSKSKELLCCLNNNMNYKHSNLFVEAQLSVFIEFS